MQKLLLLPAAGLLLAAPGLCDVTLIARGTVSTNSIGSGPLSNAVSGDPVTMTFAVVTPGNETTPGQVANYQTDPATFQIDAGGNVQGATNSVTMMMVNDFPVSDGVYIFFSPLGGGLSMEFEVGNGDGTFFDSVDITQEAGTLTNTMISSFNWAYHGGGSMFVDFLELTIEPATGNGTPYCFGDGSGATCPCGNAGGADQGCANSTGAGATLVDTGSSSVGTGDLGFTASGLLPFQPALLFVGEDALGGGAGIPFGDGLRCAGNNVVRLGTQTPNPLGEAVWGPGLAGGWAAGDVRYFQAWYRDPVGGPCGSGFNLSQGVELTFVP